MPHSSRVAAAVCGSCAQPRGAMTAPVPCRSFRARSGCERVHFEGPAAERPRSGDARIPALVQRRQRSASGRCRAGRPDSRISGSSRSIRSRMATAASRAPSPISRSRGPRAHCSALLQHVSANPAENGRTTTTFLERTQKGTLDVTVWMEWFLGCLGRTIDGAQTTVAAVLRQAALLGGAARRPDQRASACDAEVASWTDSRESSPRRNGP